MASRAAFDAIEGDGFFAGQRPRRRGGGVVVREGGGVALVGGAGARDGMHADLESGRTKGGPEGLVHATPAAELAGGVEPGVGVDEGGPGAVACDGELPGEVARGDARPAGVDAARQQVGTNPEAGEVADLVLFGREPG